MGKLYYPSRLMTDLFAIAVTRQFSPKSGQSKEKIYCKLIDRILKCYSTRVRAALYDQQFPSYVSFARTSSAVNIRRF